MSDSNSDTYEVTVYEHDHGRRKPDEPEGGTHEATYECVGHKAEGSFVLLRLADGSQKLYPEHSFTSLETEELPSTQNRP